MRPSGVIHLYRVRLRARFMQELLAVGGIAVGVALVFAALVANTSLVGSVRELSSGIVGNARLQLSARGADGLDERLVATVERIDGVKASVPILERQANLIGPGGQRSVTLVGGDARSRLLGASLIRQMAASSQLSTARALALPAPVATALGVSLGRHVRVESGGRNVRAPVGVVLRRSDYGAFVDSPIAIVPLTFAQEASGMRGRVSRIFVQTAPGRERDVEAALVRIADGKANVRRADHDLVLFEQAALPTTQSVSIFSVFSALIGFLFAFSAVLLTVPQRRRFIADLRMAGHEPWVVIQLLLFDVLVLGAAGSLVGLLAGDQISRHVFRTPPSYLTYAFAVGDQRIVQWQSVAIAVGAGVAAAGFAVLAPLRDVLSRHGSADATGRDGYGSSLLAVPAGLAALAASTAIVAYAPQAGIASLTALMAALLLLLPTLLRAGAAAFEALTRGMRTPVPTLAALELRSRSARMRAIALASTGAIAVFAMVAIGGAHDDLQRGLDAAASEVDRNGDVWATFPGAANAFATTPFPVNRALTAEVRKVPGVERVAVYRGSFLDVRDRRVWIQAPPRSAPAPVPPSQLREGDLALATARLRAGGWAVVSRAIADYLDVGIGDRVTLPSPVPTTLRVAAISTNLGWPSGALVLNADDYGRAWGSATPSALQIRVAAGASPARVAAAVRRTLAPRVPVQVETLRQRLDRHFAASREVLSRSTQVTVLVLISALLAMTAAMGGMIWQRRPAFAALKVHGYPEGELWRALLLESGLLLGTGCLVGAVFGLYGQVLMDRTLETMTDFPIVYETAGFAALGVLALVTVVAVAMIALPGWLAVRVRATPGGAI